MPQASDDSTHPDKRHQDTDGGGLGVGVTEYGRNEVVEFLLDRGVDVRAGEKNDQTGLHWAVIGRQLDTVKLLLKRGAPLEAKNVYGGTVLGQATWCVINGDRSADYVPIISALLEAGARVEEADFPTGNDRVDDLFHHRGE